MAPSFELKTAEIEKAIYSMQTAFSALCEMSELSLTPIDPELVDLYVRVLTKYKQAARKSRDPWGIKKWFGRKS